VKREQVKRTNFRRDEPEELRYPFPVDFIKLGVGCIAIEGSSVSFFGPW
jgi:hypothetical protein